jgi:hypothetical protein
VLGERRLEAEVDSSERFEATLDEVTLRAVRAITDAFEAVSGVDRQPQGA